MSTFHPARQLRPLCLFALTAFGVADSAAAARDIQFNRDIRPILSDNCFACHGPDKEARKAKLRLDTQEGAYAKQDDVTAVAPGHPEKSEAVARIESTDPEEVMPPPKSGKQLTARQKQLLKEWIAQGAKYDGHWAYRPPTRGELPTAAGSTHPIDAFILDRLRKESLAPAPEADRRTLLRRVSLDLTGLPPTPEQVRHFEKSSDPKAYEKLVDELLASPHYGERLAVHWLDLVRYADTIGYHGDVPISVWPYRDYVIRAFNENLPFDRFTREQLAGDLLPGSTEQQKIASTFNRLNRMSTEGGIQDKEYLAKYAADRVRTVSTTWLGSTVGCAECHDHKFDPFSAKDFYSMAAFFADLKEQGFYDRGFSEGNWGPKLLLPSPEQKTRLEKVDGEIAALKQQLEQVTDAQLAPGRTEWEAAVLALDKGGEVAWKVQSPLSATTSNGATLTNGSDNLILAGGKNPDNETYTITFQPGAGAWRGLRLHIFTDEQYAGNRVARGGTGFIVTEAEVLAGNTESPSAVKLAHVVTSSEAEGFPALAMLDGRRETGWGNPIGHSSEQQAAFHFAEPLVAASDTVVTVRLRHDHDQRKVTIGKFRLSLTAVEKPSLRAPVPEDVLKALRVEAEKRNDKQQQTIARHYRAIAPELTGNTRQLARFQAERSLLAAEIPSTLVSVVRDQPRPMRILPRGDWMNDSGELVQPAGPHFLTAVAKTGGERATRLDLANWLTAKQNPLAARAFVNRLWKIYFGTGLSRTLDDLGTQGEWPTHLELLDWLACEFMDRGWDVKHLVRLIVTSGTYRASSTSTPALDEKDPLNRLLARQARLRLDAELVRDYALSVSGLLVPEIGGPSVRPYQPEGYYAPLNFPKREYSHDRGAKLYRRTLYTHMQRTFPHPLLTNFDASGREECTAIRMTSNTPLQALNLLNDPIFVEAARVFAASIVERGGGTFEERLSWAYQRALTREPTAREIELLRALFDQQRARYRTDESGASALLRVGEAPLPKGNAPELAAWTGVARAILNLNEVVTRN
ncbi:MAG: DUF1553 domain-containing protein [Verrucomicrobia bacterium]|nr:MAG: DUF1553 domain-containing protein [Verrucomicrobiota bacterium]